MRNIKLLIALISLIVTSAVYSNEARIISMGKTDAFFMDELSVLRSPANLGVYGSFLIGDFGTYMDTTLSSNFYLKNEDPSHPWFGGFVGIGGDAKTSVGMFSIGAIVNRIEKIDTLWFNKLSVLPTFKYWKPQMPLDLVMAYNVNPQLKLGLRVHGAMGKYTQTIGSINYERSSVVGLAIAGARFEANDKELEISAGASLTRVDTVLSSSNTPDNNIGFVGYARLFSEINNSADLVITGGYENYKFLGNDEYKNLYAGLGFNVLIDRGFLWFGVTAKQNQMNYGSREDKITGASLNFGIERSVWWDWFIMRLGGNKFFGYKEVNTTTISGAVPIGTKEKMMITNADATKMPDDAIGFGIGLNIDDRLRFDGVVAEDIPFTFTNLMSGSSHHIFTRLSGTLSF